MGANYFRHKLATMIPGPRSRNIALIQAWADDSASYASCALYTFRNDCLTDRADPSADECLKRAKEERECDATGRQRELCDETAQLLEDLAKKLYPLA